MTRDLEQSLRTKSNGEAVYRVTEQERKSLVVVTVVDD